MPDKLTKIMEVQALEIIKLNKNLDVPIISNEESLSKICIAIIDQCIELQRTTNWKWWKNKIYFNEKDAREKLVTLWQFIIQASLILKMSPDDILREFEKKHKINMQRQHDNY